MKASHITSDGIDLPATSGAADSVQRGPSAARPFSQRHSVVAIDGGDVKQATIASQSALQNGATSLLFWLHREEDLTALTQGIRLDIAPVHLVGNMDPLKVKMAMDKHPNYQAWHGGFIMDPAENRQRTQQWFTQALQGDMDRLAQACEILPSGLRCITSNGNSQSKHGHVAQIAFAVASLEAQLQHVGWHHANRCMMILQASDDYLGSIAMVQAARELWQSMLIKHQQANASLWVAGFTADRDASDDAANLIDTGMNLQALWLGGCDELLNQPINLSPEAGHWALEQQLVLANETDLKDDEPLRGSYTLDAWTAQMVNMATEHMDRWEQAGGLMKLLDKDSSIW